MKGFLRGSLLAALSGIALAGCGGGGNGGGSDNNNPSVGSAPTTVVQPRRYAPCPAALWAQYRFLLADSGGLLFHSNALREEIYEACTE